MKVTINKRLYDTERSKLIHHRSYRYYGDPAGYEEKIFQELSGQYFLQGIGGKRSPYPEPIIRLMKKSEVIEWAQKALKKGGRRHV